MLALMRDTKKRVAIESLLIWAYREELPKRPTAAFSPWERLITLGTVVDSGYSDEPGFVTDEPCHPDAATLAVAVGRLPEVTLIWEQVVDQLMGDFAPYAPATDPTLARMAFQPSALVALHARTGTTPQWDLGPVRLARVPGANGKPVVNGMTAGGRYGEGAGCPLRLQLERAYLPGRMAEPSAGRDIAAARAEYYIWWLSLDALAECWIGQDHEALPPAVPAAPWEASTSKKPRLLRVIQ